MPRDIAPGVPRHSRYPLTAADPNVTHGRKNTLSSAGSPSQSGGPSATTVERQVRQQDPEEEERHRRPRPAPVARGPGPQAPTGGSPGRRVTVVDTTRLWLRGSARRPA